MNNTNRSVGASEPPKSWLRENVAKPFMWIAVGFVACKVLDAYTENKKARRLTS